jgi:mRNA interferase MazF
VYIIRLDPVVGFEMKKTRPCLVVSPDLMNRTLRTVMVAPMTTRGRAFASRVECVFLDRSGFIALDQLRTVDRSRLVKNLGRIGHRTQEAVLAKLAEIFAP